MVGSSKFDVFLAHNSVDKPQVRAIAKELRKRGLKPWLDEEQIMVGDSIPRKVQEGLIQSPVAAFFIGTSGFGKFQETWELDALIMLCYQNHIRIIPILLPGVDTLPDELVLFRGRRYLQFCQSVDETEPLKELVQAITTTVQPLEKEAKRPFPSLQVFEFEVVTVDVQSRLLGLSSKVTLNRSHGQARYFTENLGNKIALDMVAIPGGKFLMGTEDEEIERLCKEYDEKWFRKEKPQHEVTVQPFFMGKYPVTQAQWKAIASRADLKVERDLDPNPAYFEYREDSDRRPVEQICWEEAVEFCQRLSKQTGKQYRLPSEAEWEYACRAGTITPFHFGETIGTNLANYKGTDWEQEGKVYPGNYGRGLKGIFRKQTTPVGYFKVANNFGLYDMHGNVWEWCEDDGHDNYQGAPTDGSAWLSGESNYKVVHGGSWGFVPHFCRSAFRFGNTRSDRSYFIGFRVVCVAPRIR